MVKFLFVYTLGLSEGPSFSDHEDHRGTTAGALLP